tara:strand:+ start:71 stop:283 length:213 start_codon:yes stop_codon:yes gene_type:complete
MRKTMILSALKSSAKIRNIVRPKEFYKQMEISIKEKEDLIKRRKMRNLNKNFHYFIIKDIEKNDDSMFLL